MEAIFIFTALAEKYDSKRDSNHHTRNLQNLPLQISKPPNPPTHHDQNNTTQLHNLQPTNNTIMADEAGASAPPTEPLANLHLDEVTGEQVSKSELKKRQKQRQKDEAKKEREAAAPPKPATAKKTNAEADEKELNPNVYSETPSTPHFAQLILTAG